MTFAYEERQADSPFVQTIWRTQSDENGSNIVVADSSWDMLFWKLGENVLAVVSGPMSKAVPIPYTQEECLGIQFRVGAFMPHLPTNAIVDGTQRLPVATSTSFWLNDSHLTFPRYDEVELFVEKLAREGLIAQDEIVDAVLQEQTQAISQRSVQRRFLRTTGLSYRHLRTIERARHAAALLEQGMSILDVVYDAGYTDQPHLTKALKRYVGQTPAQLARAVTR